MKKNEIEEKERQIFDFTAKYIEENGYPPSVREICSSLGVKSTATVYAYLNRLKSKGLLEKSPMKKRALAISNGGAKFKSIPIIGVIRAGEPIFAIQNLEGYCPLPPEFSDSSADFALNVTGDSMINAGIMDKDVILVKSQNDAVNGDIVVALVEESATVKRFFIKKGKIVLHPENDNMQDMIFDNVQILGVVKGLIRKF